MADGQRIPPGVGIGTYNVQRQIMRLSPPVATELGDAVEGLVQAAIIVPDNTSSAVLELIAKEDPRQPRTDAQIAADLDVPRRDITYARKQLNIPPSSIRYKNL